MNNALKLLYDSFYTSLLMEESEQKIEYCHRHRIERLEKPDRKPALQIMGAQNLMVEERSMDI